MCTGCKAAGLILDVIEETVSCFISIEVIGYHTSGSRSDLGTFGVDFQQSAHYEVYVVYTVVKLFQFLYVLKTRQYCTNTFSCFFFIVYNKTHSSRCQEKISIRKFMFWHFFLALFLIFSNNFFFFPITITDIIINMYHFVMSGVKKSTFYGRPMKRRKRKGANMYILPNFQMVPPLGNY